MKHSSFRQKLLISLAVTFLLILPTAAGAQPAGPRVDLSSLEAVSTTPLTVTWDSQTGVPAFVAGRFPAGATARILAADPFGASLNFLRLHRHAFGIASPEREFALMRADVDRLGMTHVRLQQTYQGAPVLGAELMVHFDATGDWITVVNGDYLPGLMLRTVKPGIQPGTALRVARSALPGSQIQRRPRLMVADGRLDPELAGSHLVWRVELYDQGVPARNVYLIDAQTGLILRSYNRLATGRDRLTYTANHTQTLPGTLWLTEAGPVPGQSPDADGLNAHQFAGDTYDYYSAVHGRDSYDNNGATLIASVHYGTNYQNAFWNGAQMVYGDSFASANDVVAHELTHAVTENTANLVYAFQSGALNESFSDIFGAMVDDEDWLMGEDLPIGAIRSLSSPSAFGDPENLGQYVSTCEDNGGVHTNSGIPNKAAYLLSEAVGRPVAGQILYRTLTYYLTSSAGFNDARAAVIQAAQDLYGAGSDEEKETTAAFAAVGLDGVNEPPPPSCDCAASATLSDRALFQDLRFSLRAAVTLYRTRDHLLSRTPVGQRYIDLYYAHTGQISRLLAKDPALRQQAAGLLQSVAPGLAALLDGDGDQVVVTPAMTRQLQTLLDSLAAADAGGPLARTIAAERSRLKLESLTGLTFTQAWRVINRSGAPGDFAGH
ncbi:MAG: M4 family metallopeptidase [Anaerolineae bacterium]